MRAVPTLHGAAGRGRRERRLLGGLEVVLGAADKLHEAQHKLWAHFFDGPAANTRSKKAAQQPQQRG